MNAPTLANPSLVKVLSYIYFIPLGITAVVLLALALNGADLFADPASSPVGNLYLLVFLPVFLFFAIATPVYFIILLAYSSSQHASSRQKIMSILIMMSIAILWAWQVPARFIG
jgi:hypothetical protein